MVLEKVVTPGNIEGELSKIWNGLQGGSKMRASLFNLIFYIDRDERIAYFRNLAQRIIEKFPSRIIFIILDSEAKEEELKAKVSVISAHDEKSDVACDLIEIGTTLKFQARVPSVILPHILPDLPVYLVWGEDPMRENPISSELEGFATRLIFDSETTSTLAGFAKSLIKRQERSCCDVADLNWARLENWRDLFSKNFHLEERFIKLQHLSKLEIHYNAQETTFFHHTKIQSIYLQTWLACRLQWQPKRSFLEKEVLHFLYEGQKKNEIDIVLIPNFTENLSSGSILSVELDTSEGDHFSFRRESHSPHQIMMHFTNLKQCEVPSQYMFPKAESGRSLVREICHKGMSLHYLGVLNFLARAEMFNLF